MDNVIKFPKIPGARHRAMCNLLETENYLSFWFDSEGELHYSFGNGMTLEQMTYLLKILGIIVTDTIKSETENEVT